MKMNKPYENVTNSEKEVRKMKRSDIVTPCQLAKETGRNPQQIYGWIREGKLPSHKCICGHTYIVRQEWTDFDTNRKNKSA